MKNYYGLQISQKIDSFFSKKITYLIKGFLNLCLGFPDVAG